MATCTDSDMWVKKVNTIYDVKNSPKDIAEYYDKGVLTYDSIFVKHYHGYKMAAAAVSNLLGDSKERRIMDIAAGSGQVGMELDKYGFTNMDAVELAPEMIRLAKEKNLYRKIICAFVTSESLDIAAGTYDCVVSAGGFGKGHVPADALHEFSRLTCKGGCIVITMRHEWFEEDDFGMREIINKWNGKKWEIIDISQFENYFAGMNGCLIQLRVL